MVQQFTYPATPETDSLPGPELVPVAVGLITNQVEYEYVVPRGLWSKFIALAPWQRPLVKSGAE